MSACPICEAVGYEPCKTWRGLTFLDGTRHEERDTLNPGTVRERSVSVSGRVLKVEESVRFVDSLRQAHTALVTEVHGDPANEPSINLVYVSRDAKKRDDYGQQIERMTSVVHGGDQKAHGNFWEFAD